LLYNKSAKSVAEKLGVNLATVRDVSAGKSYKWLQKVIPKTYNKLMATKGGGLSYYTVKGVLETKISNLQIFNKTLAKQYKIDATQVSHVIKCTKKWLSNLREQDAEIAALYNKIGEII